MLYFQSLIDFYRLRFSLTFLLTNLVACTPLCAGDLTWERNLQKTYCINLPPQAWKRAGISGQRFYDQQIHEKLAFGLFMTQQHGKDKPFEGILHLDVTFFMAIPKGRKNKDIGSPHSKYPDLDNLLKLLCDTMVKSGILVDDRFISSITASKVYDINPRTIFTLKQIETE